MPELQWLQCNKSYGTGATWPLTVLHAERSCFSHASYHQTYNFGRSIGHISPYFHSMGSLEELRDAHALNVSQNVSFRVRALLSTRNFPQRLLRKVKPRVKFPRGEGFLREMSCPEGRVSLREGFAQGNSCSEGRVAPRQGFPLRKVCLEERVAPRKYFP